MSIYAQSTIAKNTTYEKVCGISCIHNLSEMAKLNINKGKIEIITKAK